MRLWTSVTVTFSHQTYFRHLQIFPHSRPKSFSRTNGTSERCPGISCNRAQGSILSQQHHTHLSLYAKNTLHRLFSSAQGTPFNYKSVPRQNGDMPFRPVTNLSSSRLSRQMVSSVQNNPFPKKGHSYPLRPLLCMRNHAQHHCREIIPDPTGLRIASCFSPPFHCI